MILGFFLRIIPYFLLILFIFFEFAPAYFSEKEIIKPYFTFMFLYALINNDSERFRPFWILLVGLFYDFLDGDVVGITSLFFLITLHLLRRKHSTIISVDFRIIWTNFILILLAYISVNKVVKFILFDVSFELKRITLSFFISIILFPLFNSIVRKFKNRLSYINE
jgi:rod shape-determining protein MreD